MIQALKALGLVDAAGGRYRTRSTTCCMTRSRSPPASSTDAARRSSLAAALRGVLAGAGTGETVTWAVGGATVSIDLGRRTLSVDGTGAGATPWTVHATVPVGGRPDLQLTLGTAGSTPAGGAELSLTTAPTTSLVARWHPPGAGAPTTVRLWPDPDAAAGLAMLARMVPAELGRRGLEYLRRLDESVRPVADAALDAVGLLATATAAAATASGPSGFHSPWSPIRSDGSRHAGALGGSAGFDPPRVIAFLDALKPILGVSGSPGRWEVATGVTIAAGDSTGRTRLGLEVASSALTPIPPADATVEITLDAGLVLAPDGPPIVQLDLALGMPGASTLGTQAVHVTLDSGTGIAVFLRPGSGADIPLYPHPPGLGSIASAATRALPFVLNALADETGNDLAGQAGAVVRAVGDAMALRTGSPLSFHDAELQAWAADPGGQLAARLPALATSVLQALSNAVGPALPAGVTIAVSGNELQVTSASVVVGLNANPFAVRLLADARRPSRHTGRPRRGRRATAPASGPRRHRRPGGPRRRGRHPAAVCADRRRQRTRGRPPRRARPRTRRRRRAPVRGALDPRRRARPRGGRRRDRRPQTPAAVAGAVVDAVVDLAGGLVIGTDAVQDLLAPAMRCVDDRRRPRGRSRPRRRRRLEACPRGYSTRPGARPLAAAGPEPRAASRSPASISPS